MPRPPDLLGKIVDKLSAQEVADGLLAADQNARRLLDDAELLLREKRFASSLALSILSIEESGKKYVLRRIALVQDQKQLKEYWRDFRSHRAKNSIWILPKLVMEGARTLLDLGPALDKSGDHTAELDSLKQIAIYTDFLGKRNWSKPIEVIDQKTAEGMMKIARVSLGAREVSVREVELWMEVVGPHIDTPEMGSAVLAYQQQLVDEGLSDISPTDLAGFMEGLVDKPSN